MNRYVVAVVLALVAASASLAEQSARPHGQPQNAWRYVRYNGRWWYWTSGGQWSLYNGQQWATFQPHSIGSSLAGKGKQPSPQVNRGEFYNSLGANTRSILDSTRTQSPSPQPLGATGPMNPLGSGRTTLGAGLEPTRRSGDAGSGVGGGSVGGTNVTSEAASSPPR